ncbi:hypothetical protein EON65_06910, partial [archaeon]
MTCTIHRAQSKKSKISIDVYLAIIFNMYATPTKNNNPLSGFSPGLSPISQADVSMQQSFQMSAYNTPDRSIATKLSFPAQHSTPAHPPLPRIVEESSLSESNAQEKDSPAVSLPSPKPLPLGEATALQSISLLNLTPERPKIANNTALLDSVSYLPITPAGPRPVERRAGAEGGRGDSTKHNSTEQAQKQFHDGDIEPDASQSISERSKTNQEIIQSIKDKYKRWVGDGKEGEDEVRKDVGVSTDDIPQYTTDHYTGAGSLPIYTPTPQHVSTSVHPTTPPNVNITSTSSVSALPVGSLYALVLDQRANPLLVP